PEGYAVLIEAEHFASAGPRRGGEGQAVLKSLRSIKLFATSRVVARKQPPVEEHVKAVVIDQRAGVIGRGLGLRPDDVLVGGLALAQRDVPLGPRLDGVDRTFRIEDVAGAQVQEPARLVGRGD